MACSQQSCSTDCSLFHQHRYNDGTNSLFYSFLSPRALNSLVEEVIPNIYYPCARGAPLPNCCLFLAGPCCGSEWPLLIEIARICTDLTLQSCLRFLASVQSGQCQIMFFLQEWSLKRQFSTSSIQMFQVIKCLFTYLVRAKWWPFKVTNMNIKNWGQLMLSYISFGWLCHLEDIHLLFLLMS